MAEESSNSAFKNRLNTALTFDTLVEVGSAVPDALLDELGRLVQPADAARATDAELRVLWAQMLGWISGALLGEQLDRVQARTRQDGPRPEPPAVEPQPTASHAYL